MMIPLIPSEDLEANPNFAKVWEIITTQLLDGDGSTRREKEARLRAWQEAARSSQRSLRDEDEAPGTVVEGVDEDELDEKSFVSEQDRNSHGDGEKEAGPNFEELLRQVRVQRAKQTILRELLAEVAYLSDDTRITTGASEKMSRIPVRSKAELELQEVTNTSLDDAGSHEPSVVDNPDDNVQAQTLRLGKLRDLILIISAYLDASLDASSGRVFTSAEEDLLSDDIDRFKENISIIAEAMSSGLSDLESSVSKIANLVLEDPNGRDRSQHPGSSLPETVQTQLANLHTIRTTTLPSSLTRLNTTLHSLLSLQRTLLHLQLQHLETSKHGVLSRYHASKIAFLSTVAQTMALKSQVMVLETKSRIELSPEVEQRRHVMRTKMHEMEEEEAEFDVRIRILEEVLGEYEALDPGGKGEGGGLEVMRKLGRRYKEIEEEMEGVNGDIETLEKKGKV